MGYLIEVVSCVDEKRKCIEVEKYTYIPTMESSGSSILILVPEITM